MESDSPHGEDSSCQGGGQTYSPNFHSLTTEDNLLSFEEQRVEVLLPEIIDSLWTQPGLATPGEMFGGLGSKHTSSTQFNSEHIHATHTLTSDGQNHSEPSRSTHPHTSDIHLISERPPALYTFPSDLRIHSEPSRPTLNHTPGTHFNTGRPPAAYTFTSDPRNHSEPYRPTCTHHTTYSDIPHSRAAPRCIHIYVGRTEPLGAVPSDMHPSHTTDTFHSRAAHRCVHGSVGRTEPLGAVPSGTHSPPGDFRVPPQDPHTTDAAGPI